MTDGKGNDPDNQADEDFAQAWEHGDDLDVGADTSEFAAFKGDDTAELLRRQVRDGDRSDGDRSGDDLSGGDLSDDDLRQSTEPGGQGPVAAGPRTWLILGALAVVFVVVAVLYVLN